MSRRRTLIYSLVAILLLLALLLGWTAFAYRGRSQLAAAFGARLTCSCRYVEGRAMGSCQDDREPGMWMVRLDDRPDTRSVEASVPLLAHRTARFRPGWGCLLDPVG